MCDSVKTPPRLRIQFDLQLLNVKPDRGLTEVKGAGWSPPHGFVSSGAFGFKGVWRSLLLLTSVLFIGGRRHRLVQVLVWSQICNKIKNQLLIFYRTWCSVSGWGCTNILFVGFFASRPKTSIFSLEWSFQTLLSWFLLIILINSPGSSCLFSLFLTSLEFVTCLFFSHTTGLVARCCSC